MINLLFVALGGALGSVARYALGHWTRILWPHASWPWGTFLANVLGGLCMGVLVGALKGYEMERYRLLLGVGVLGGFTTFSTYSLEVVIMMERKTYGMALLYALTSAILAIGAVMLGLIITRKTLL